MNACAAEVGFAPSPDPDAWLDKPYRFNDLLTLVRRYVVSEGGVLQAQ